MSTEEQFSLSWKYFTMNTTEAGTGTGSDQVDSELVFRLAIQLEDADACFPAFKGCQGGMKAYKEVYDNQEDMQLDEILVQAFSKDLDSFGLSTSHNKLQT